jgi:hypothetical protein
MLRAYSRVPSSKEYRLFWVESLCTHLRLACPKGFGYDEVREMWCNSSGQACARCKAISAQTRMPRARLAAGKIATYSDAVSQRSSELVRSHVFFAIDTGYAHLLSQISSLTLYFPAIHQRKGGF